LLAVFLGKDLGGGGTTNESWRTGKDLVAKSAEYVGFVGGKLEKGDRPLCNQRTLKGWKWIRL